MLLSPQYDCDCLYDFSLALIHEILTNLEQKASFMEDSKQVAGMDRSYSTSEFYFVILLNFNT